jgi:protein-disulfide isomerase
LLAKGVAVRPKGMNRFLAAVFVLSVAGVGAAQTSMPPNQVSTFKDTSMFKPPAGAKVGIIEFEDLECPACAHAFPLVHTAAKQYNIPLARYDFPLKMHIWSHDAAVIARYLQDKVSPDVATEYRREVFASQFQIASKDDMHNFSVKFFQAHGQQFPFVIDPTGQFTKEVDADEALGEKVGLGHTPTIVVVTDHKGWIEVADASQLYAAIDSAIAATKNETSAPAPAHHATTTAKK